MLVMRSPFVASFALVASTFLLACVETKSKDGSDGGPSESGGSGGGGKGSGGRGDGGGSGGSEVDGSPGGDGGESPREGGAGTGGASGSTGGRSSGSGGAPVDGGDSAGALPASTFLYTYAETPDHDILVARDIRTGDERIVTDLTADGSEGWEIWGASISPDRKRIAIASLFGPTKADNDTRLATRRIWTLNPDGTDFQRLTPVFENTGGGRTNFTIEVSAPAFTQDGKDIIYEFGNYWYEGTTLKGASFPWKVSSTGATLPEPFDSSTSCSVLEPAVNPVTGDVLFVHSVCINRADEGIFLYPKGGGTAPTQLLQAGYGVGYVQPSLTPPSWVSDGSGFAFVGNTDVDRNGSQVTVSAVFVFDTSSGDVTPLVVAEPNEYIRAAAIAPDASGIVYCVSHGSNALDLHLLDLTTEPATDSPMTTDGKSCNPTF